MLESIYHYLFSTDAMVYRPNPDDNDKSGEVILSVGDRVSVYSTRFSEWIDDGVIVAAFRDSVKVRYGFARYFGSTALKRGNEKYVYARNLKEVLRPHRKQRQL